MAKSTAEAGLRLLENCALFRPLTAEERRTVFAYAHARRFAAGETIFLKGSPGQGIMAVLSGEVRISAPSTDGKEIILATLQAGEVFGELTLLDGKERTADAVALSPCEIVSLDRRDILPLLRRQPELCLKLLEVVCERLRRTTTLVEEILFLNVPKRLAKALLRAAGRRVSQTSAAQLHVRLSQRDLGAMIGGTRESVNRCLAEWQRRGVISIEDGVIVIANPAALKELAESETPPPGGALDG